MISNIILFIFTCLFTAEYSKEPVKKVLITFNLIV